MPLKGGKWTYGWVVVRQGGEAWAEYGLQAGIEAR